MKSCLLNNYEAGVLHTYLLTMRCFLNVLTYANLVDSRPGHNSDIKTNYKSAYVGALEPIMGSLAEPVGDASSSSTVAAVSSGVSLLARSTL